MKPTIEAGNDPLTRLSTFPPDPVRSARTRQRCRAALQGRARAAAASAREPHGGRSRAQSTAGERRFREVLAGAVGLLCLVYVVALIAITVSLHGTMR